MKKNIKKAIIVLAATIIILSMFTACGSNSAKEETLSTAAPTATESTTKPAVEETTALEAYINMGAFVNAESGGKPVVKIYGDEGVLFSFDLSENATSKVDVTINEKPEDGNFYITMAGNVTEHTLISDGSLFDGIVDIENDKAEFSVTYGENKVDFIINVET